MSDHLPREPGLICRIQLDKNPPGSSAPPAQPAPPVFAAQDYQSFYTKVERIVGKVFYNKKGQKVRLMTSSTRKKTYIPVFIHTQLVYFYEISFEHYIFFSLSRHFHIQGSIFSLQQLQLNGINLTLLPFPLRAPCAKPGLSFPPRNTISSVFPIRILTGQIRIRPFGRVQTRPLRYMRIRTVTFTFFLIVLNHPFFDSFLRLM